MVGVNCSTTPLMVPVMRFSPTKSSPVVLPSLSVYVLYIEEPGRRFSTPLQTKTMSPVDSV